MGFDRQNRSGYNFTPSVIIHGQILYKIANFLSSYIATNTKIMKICSETKIWLQNANLGSEISYGAS